MGASLLLAAWVWGAGLLRAASPPVVEALASGDSLVVVEDRRAPLVEIRLLLPAGRASPWWRQSGGPAAWHLLLRPQEDRHAAVLELEPGHDDWSTTLTARCHRDDLAEAAGILAGMLRQEGGDEGEVDREILRRWRSGQAVPPWQAAEADPRRALQALAGRLLLGPRDPRWEVETPVRLSPGRVRRARALLPRLPGRVIGFAGDLSREEAQKQAARILPAPLARPPRGLDPKIPAPRAEAGGGGMVEARVPARGRGWVLLARPGLAEDDPDQAALRLAVHALAGSGRSRLYQRLRHEEGLTYAIDAEDGSGPAPGVLLVVASASPDRVEEMAEAAAEVLAAFASGGMTAAELAAAQGALRLEEALCADDPACALGRAVERARHGLSPALDAGILARAEAIPLAEANAFVARFFDPGEVAIVRAQAGAGWGLE